MMLNEWPSPWAAAGVNRSPRVAELRRRVREWMHRPRSRQSPAVKALRRGGISTSR